MIKLYDNGIYLVDGKTIVNSPEELKALTGKEVTREEALKGTMAYGSKPTTRSTAWTTFA